MRVPDAFDRNDAHELDDADGIRCRRCGTEGLYWQRVTQADGRTEKSVLFDSHTKRRHECPAPGADAFSEVKG
jgi:hypothetical protein